MLLLLLFVHRVLVVVVGVVIPQPVREKESRVLTVKKRQGVGHSLGVVLRQ